MTTVTDDVSGADLAVKRTCPYRVYDGLLGIEQVSEHKTNSSLISQTESWLCSLNAAGDILLDREPSEGMEDYRTLEEYL